MGTYEILTRNIIEILKVVIFIMYILRVFNFAIKSVTDVILLEIVSQNFGYRYYIYHNLLFTNKIDIILYLYMKILQFL